ncbi:MAG: hypothetical protein AAGJ35_05360, partial [Myxococcota bacterium]
FALHHLLHHRFVRGPSQRLPRLLHPYVPPSLSVQELISVLLGDPPLLQAETIQWSHNRGLLVHKRRGKSFKQTLWIDERRQHIVKLALDWKKKPAVLISYGGFHPTTRLPKAVRFRVKSRGLQLHWLFTQQKTNTKLKDRFFRQDVPKNTPVQDL